MVGLTAVVAARPDHARGPAARLDRRRHRQRRDLLGAARLEHRAAPGAHRSRASRASTTRWRSCWCSGSSSRSSSPTTACPTCSCCASAELGIGAAVGLADRRAGGAGLPARATSPPPASTRGVDGASRRWRSAAADVLARLGLHRRLPHRPGAGQRARSPAGGRSRTSTTGSRGSARSRSSSRSGCSCTRATSATSSARRC